MHTPTPWRYIKKESLIIGKSEICSMAEFRDGSGDYPNAEINAEFIVTAVNAHAELVKTIQSWEIWIQSQAHEVQASAIRSGLFKLSLDALAKAGIKL